MIPALLEAVVDEFETRRRVCLGGRHSARGTVRVRRVSAAAETRAARPPIVTRFSDATAEKPVPCIVASWPSMRTAGSIPVMRTAPTSSPTSSAAAAVTRSAPLATVAETVALPSASPVARHPMAVGWT